MAGESSRIAERHYLQTTDALWERAIDDAGPMTENTASNGINGSGSRQDFRESRHRSKLLTSSATSVIILKVLRRKQARPVGVEQSPKTRGNTQSGVSAVSVAVSFAHGDGEKSSELLAIWKDLDEPSRDNLMEVARELASRSN